MEPTACRSPARDGLALGSEAYHCRRQTAPEVVGAGGQREDCHDLRRGHNIEAGLAYRRVDRPTEARDNGPQSAVLHVDHAPPGDVGRTETGYLAALGSVVSEGREKIVCRGHGVGIAREVDVDLILRDHP